MHAETKVEPGDKATFSGALKMGESKRGGTYPLDLVCQSQKGAGGSCTYAVLHTPCLHSFFHVHDVY